MFLDVLGRRHRDQIAGPIIEGVAVAVMDDVTLWDGLVLCQEHSLRAGYPSVCRLDPSARLAVLVVSDGDAAQRKFFAVRLARLELSIGR